MMDRQSGKFAMVGHRQTGFSFLEVLLGIVVIAISFSGLVAAIGGSLLSSNNPEVRYEALSVAQSYMAEIQAMSHIIDPSAAAALAPGTNLSAPCKSQPPATGTPRAFFNEICDFHGLRESPSGRDGQSVAGLDYLSVEVKIFYNESSAAMSGSGSGNAIGGLSAATGRNVALIEVEVKYGQRAGSVGSVLLRSYVTRPCDGVVCS